MNCVILGLMELPEVSSRPDAVTVIRAFAGIGSKGVRMTSRKSSPKDMEAGSYPL